MGIRNRLRAGVAALALLAAGAAGASAEIAISANDNKAVLRNGVAGVAQNPAPDTISIIDLAARPPRVAAEIQVPTSVV
ncbi:hypothetical protein M0638_16585, partial [Roseomonas sp. NAR14]|nr:hypothetical protein [Roseomonas acroporae]